MAQDVSSNSSGKNTEKAGVSNLLQEAPLSMGKELSQFIGARRELASIEAKEAAEFAFKKTISGVILAGSLLFAWALILAASTGVLAPLAEKLITDKYYWLPGWAAVLFIFGILHLNLALICVFLLKKKPSSPLFRLSLLEIQKDKQWLKKSK